MALSHVSHVRQTKVVANGREPVVNIISARIGAEIRLMKALLCSLILAAAGAAQAQKLNIRIVAHRDSEIEEEGTVCPSELAIQLPR